jgi:hypothetical protein
MSAQQPTVWIVDSEQWPRAGLRAELIERGCDAIGYATLVEAAALLKYSGAPRPRVIVLELRDQELRREHLELLASSGIPIVLLGGAIELNHPILHKFNFASVIRRPFTLGAVANDVIALL